MKTRLKMDGVLLALLVAATLAFLSEPRLYPAWRAGKDIVDALGVILVTLGIALRMVARGYKKANSPTGAGLAQGGPYQYVRNPMYLGTFLIGTGFTAIIWPWWALPVFAFLFYLRFIRQIRIEETHLSSTFGERYARYCREVPRFFPQWGGLRAMNLREDFPWAPAWTTSESRMIFLLPLAAVLTKLAADAVIWGVLTPTRVLGCLGVCMVFSLVIWRTMPRSQS